MTVFRIVDALVSTWGAAWLRIEMQLTEKVDFSIFWDHSQGASAEHPDSVVNAAHHIVAEWKREHPLLLGSLLLAARDRALEEGEPDPCGHVGLGQVVHAERRGEDGFFRISTNVGTIEIVATMDLSVFRPTFPKGLSDADAAVVYGTCYQAICEAALDREDWAASLGMDPDLLARQRRLAAATRARTMEQ